MLGRMEYSADLISKTIKPMFVLLLLSVLVRLIFGDIQFGVMRLDTWISTLFAFNVSGYSLCRYYRRRVRRRDK